jgi:replicative DNA helicase
MTPKTVPLKSVDQATAQNLPPQNMDAEYNVLGAIFLDNDCIAKALEVISVEDFYRASHQRIFVAMVELFEKSEPIDFLTVSERLRKNKKLEEVGGTDYLAFLEENTPTSAQVVYHSRIIREKKILRELIKSATNIVSESYQDASDVDEILDNAEKSIFLIAEKKVKAGFIPIKQIIHASFGEIEKLYDRKQLVTGVPSGFADIDAKTAGFQPSDLIIIAGRPSMGKTAFSLNIARNAAVDAQVPVAFFSLEMSKEQLGLRLLCSEARVDSNKARTGFLAREDWGKLTSAGGRLTDVPLYIDDTPSLSVLDVRARSRRLMSEKGLGMVVVDYLQLMRGAGRSENRQLEISEMTRSLKALAKELNVPLVVLSQLSRKPEERADKKPILSDLRDSGAIEQDADVVIFIHREEFYKEDTDRPGVADVTIGKQRNGPTGNVELAFDKEITRFDSLAKLEPV